MVLHRQSLKAAYDFIKNELDNNTIHISKVLSPIDKWIISKQWEKEKSEVCVFSVENKRRLSDLGKEAYEYTKYSVQKFYLCARVDRAERVFSRDYLTSRNIANDEDVFIIEGIALKDWCKTCDKCIILRRGSH